MHPHLTRLCDTHGVFLRREARDVGYHDNTIDRLVRANEWHRVRWGSFTTTERWEALDGRGRYGLLCRAAVRRSNTEVLLSHQSSINEWAAPLWGIDLSEVHLTRRDARTGRRAVGIAQHRGVLLEGDAVQHDGLWLTSATRAALEITAQADIEHSLAVIDDLIHRGLTSSEQLTSRFATMNSWPDTLHTDLILRLANGRAESVGETRVRYLCWAQHLPAPEVNYVIRDEQGRERYRVDLAWPDHGLFLEFDGFVKYEKLLQPGERASDVVVREKRREDEICRLTGWRCIRVVWADLDRPAHTAGLIRSMLREPAA